MNNKPDINQNINNLFSAFSGSSISGSGSTFGFSQPHVNKSTSTKITNQNTLIRSFAYQEDKNLKYRQTMEDIGTMTPDLTGTNKTSCFCIFDGHGGSDVVNFIKERMPQLIKQNLNELKSIESTLSTAFRKIDNELVFYDSDNTGSTATVVIIQDNYIYCANVGDSRAYLINQTSAIQISTDHKCTVESEAERIKSKGGKIVKGRVMGQLILSRSWGDLSVKKYGVSVDPSISKNIITKDETKFWVIASDGVWDVIDDKMWYEISNKFTTAEMWAKELVKTAIDKGTKDNVSCIVVSFVE